MSVATASRALAGTGRMAPETRERVRRTAHRLGYAPSAIGRSLRTRSTRTIGFVVPDVSSAFYANALKGAQHRLSEAGYQVLLMDSDERPERELSALRSLLEGRVDGIVLCSSGTDADDLRQLFRGRQMPFVMFDNVVEGQGQGRVTLANESGVRQLVSHLAEVHGHTRIGYVGGILAETGGSERLDGYRLGMLAAGLAIDPSLIRSGDWTADSGWAETEALLELAVPPSAIVYADADMAVGGLAILRSQRVAIPDEVAIVAFDAPPTGALLDPPLTTLERRDREIGEIAATMVLRALEDPAAPPLDVRIPLDLVVRRSCGCDQAGGAARADGTRQAEP